MTMLYNAAVRHYIHIFKNTFDLHVHRESKKGDTILLSISLLNIDRFSQFFHRRTQLELCNKIINKDPTSPQMWWLTMYLAQLDKRSDMQRDTNGTYED